jgi:PAS domain S-box-containing protein
MSLVDEFEETESSPRVFGDVETDLDIRVLAVDDDPDMLDLTATFLEREREEFEVEAEDDVEVALERIEEESFDAIVSDHDMPQMTGLEFLEAIRENHKDIPFILFTGKGSEEIASEAISQGVTDYLQKGAGSSHYSLLANRLINAVEQYESKKNLERSQEKFSKLVMNSTDVLAVVDESGFFDYISPACEHTLGYEQEELIGECAFDYMPPEDRQDAMERFFAAVEDPELEPTIEFRFEDPDGNFTYLGARGKNLFDDDFIEGFVVNARDITAQKERERELERQNEQLKDMRNVISHEIRSPVSVATDSLVLYRESGEPQYLDKIETAVERIDSLVDQILELSEFEMEVGETRGVPLKEAALDAWEMVSSDGNELRIESSRAIEADPHQFQQALENLFQNAVEHNDGPMTISVGTIDSGFYVEDCGTGIPEPERTDVFESGYTTDPDHTGFGLNIVKQIVVGHGWEIEICDGEDGGARFEITGVTFQPEVYG